MKTLENNLKSKWATRRQARILVGIAWSMLVLACSVHLQKLRGPRASRNSNPGVDKI